MVDIILQAVEGDAPKLKDCLPVIGALKHLREWHSAQITIATSDSKGYAVHFRSPSASDSHPTACHCKCFLLSDKVLCCNVHESLNLQSLSWDSITFHVNME